ncbi:hypothetical protein [Enterococcus faecalis]|uniref:hypothetical protein n=1 Tax=Enterococcus faecalis TaxID=1351 RepID=UPI001F2495F9|nr:hypothetical protein [Enterococcus faecalis]BDC76499.1 hypothetical protein EFK4_14020 [Enterococcus faecalis]
MKTIWQFGRTGGTELEVPDDFIVQVPFTDIPPLEDVELNQQFFIPSEGRWKEIMNQLDRENLDNLSSFYSNLEKENEEIKVKANDLAQLNGKLMLSTMNLQKENAELKAKSDSLAKLNSKAMLMIAAHDKEIRELSNESKGSVQ